MADTIFVKGTKPGVVGIWEIDPAHPQGEIFVTDKHAVEAAETALVLEALSNGRLVRSDKSGTKTQKIGEVSNERAEYEKIEAERASIEKQEAMQAELDAAVAERDKLRAAAEERDQAEAQATAKAEADKAAAASSAKNK